MYARILTIAFVLCVTALSTFASDAKPKYGPASAPRAVTLAASHGYFRSAEAPDYWALAGHYVPQFNGYSCSVASVAMVLNAARASLPKTSDDKLILQQALLESVDAEHWKDRVSGAGHDGSHGVSLEQLANVTQAAFRAHGFPKATATFIHVENTGAASVKIVRKALLQNERSAADFIIANFNQQKYTDDAEAGHIAPIAAFDANTNSVLVFDPDREWYEPYWVSLNTFVEGMATLDKGSKTNRGFVHVHLGDVVKVSKQQ